MYKRLKIEVKEKIKDDLAEQIQKDIINENERVVLRKFKDKKTTEQELNRIKDTMDQKGIIGRGAKKLKKTIDDCLGYIRNNDTVSLVNNLTGITPFQLIKIDDKIIIIDVIPFYFVTKGRAKKTVKKAVEDYDLTVEKIKYMEVSE